MIGGSCAIAGGIALNDGIVQWNGTAYQPVNVDLPSNATVSAILVANDSAATPTLTIGYNTTGTATAPTITTATIATGTAEVAPKLYLTGPGTFWQIVNTTTGKQIQFNGLTLLAGETAVLDMTSNNQTFISSFRPDLRNYLLSAPQIADWTLLPGANSISAYITGGTAATALALVFRAVHWSLDAIL